MCHAEFERKGSRGPVPKYCSQKCITKAGRTPHRKVYEKLYRRLERHIGKRRAYEFSYNRRPDVKKKNRVRMMFKWYNDPEWRASQIMRMRSTIYPEVVVATPYTGHRWLDMARVAVLGSTNLDDSKPWADDYHDDMGEAVLALLEGRDMKQAVKEYRSKEYVARRLTIHLGDWGDDEERQNRWFDTLMPTTPSAEDEAIARENVQVYVETRFKNVHTKNRAMKHKLNQPSRRRMNNGKGWRRTGRLG